MQLWHISDSEVVVLLECKPVICGVHTFNFNSPGSLKAPILYLMQR
jgi:hypothetical protein